MPEMKRPPAQIVRTQAAGGFDLTQRQACRDF